MTRHLVVRRDHTNSPIAAAIGQPWVGYCRACRYGATFTAWDYAFDWAYRHCAEADNQGFGYSRPIGNGDPAATTPDGVELIPVNGRTHRRTSTTVEKGH